MGGVVCFIGDNFWGSTMWQPFPVVLFISVLLWHGKADCSRNIAKCTELHFCSLCLTYLPFHTATSELCPGAGHSSHIPFSWSFGDPLQSEEIYLSTAHKPLLLFTSHFTLPLSALGSSYLYVCIFLPVMHVGIFALNLSQCLAQDRC